MNRWIPGVMALVFGSLQGCSPAPSTEDAGSPPVEDAGADAGLRCDEVQSGAPITIPLFPAGTRINGASTLPDGGPAPNRQRADAEISIPEGCWSKIEVHYKLRATCDGSAPAGQNWPPRCDPFDRISRLTVADEGRPELFLIDVMTPFGGDGDYQRDVTDYAPLLTGQHNFRVYISTGADPTGKAAGTQAGWDVEAFLVLTPGTPPRNVVAAAPLFFFPRFDPTTGGALATVSSPEGATELRIDLFTTGHDFKGAQRICDEFCKKRHELKLNGAVVFEGEPWVTCADNCAPIPLPPGAQVSCMNQKFDYRCEQNPEACPASAVLARANWCPGRQVEPIPIEVGLSGAAATHEVQFSIPGVQGYFAVGATAIFFADRAPQTSIASGPPAYSSSSSAAFDFEATDASAAFECALDGAAFAPCADPLTVDGLAEGPHRLEVRARTAAAADSTPAVHRWSVDLTPPDTSFEAVPPALTGASASFSFTSTEAPVTYECKLDGAAFAPCSRKATFGSLADGAHTLEVRAKDRAGNVDGTPVNHGWTADATAPDTTLSAAPAVFSPSATATFEFSASESGATFSCKLDGAAFAPCTSPLTLNNLAAGSHSFQVRAHDAAGNVDASPAAHTWTVDLTPPETTFTATPPASTADTEATFEFTSNESAATFSCSLDSAPFAACSSPATVSGLLPGGHVFEVRAQDPAGNEDGSPASHGWTVLDADAGVDGGAGGGDDAGVDGGG